MRKQSIYRIICNVLMVMFILSAAIPVHADGYWTDGWWDGATNTWHDGYWTETGAAAPAAPANDGCGWVDAHWDGTTNTWYDGYCSVYQSPASATAAPAAAAPAAVPTTSQPVWMQYYSQFDKQWSDVVIGDYSTMAANGCVPTAASMVLSHFGYTVSPLDMAYAMNSWGDYNSGYGHGTDSNAWNTLAASYGFSSWGLYSAQDTITSLAGGAVVAAEINNSLGGTHCIVLTGVDGNGNTTVYDPGKGTYTANVTNLWNNRSGSSVDTVGGGPFIALQ